MPDATIILKLPVLVIISLLVQLAIIYVYDKLKFQ